MLRQFGVTEQTWRQFADQEPSFGISETPTYVARGVAALVADPEVDRWNGRVVTARQLSDAYGTTDIDGSRTAGGLWDLHGWNSDDPAAIASIPDFR